VRVYSSRNAWTPAAAFCILPSYFFLSCTAGLFDPVFHPQPVEQRALGLLLAGCDFNQAPDGTGSNGRPALFHF
jgi:hypothetical protein